MLAQTENLGEMYFTAKCMENGGIRLPLTRKRNDKEYEVVHFPGTQR